MLKNKDFSFKDIQEKTGLSFTHIYNINIGVRRPKDDIIYPIRKKNTQGSKGIKFSKEQIQNIHLEILNTNLTFKQLGEKYQCSADTISDINRGITKAYYLEDYKYPLRKNPHSQAKKNY